MPDETRENDDSSGDDTGVALPPRSIDELFAKALELAPLFESQASLARAVNDALDIDLSSAAWRGLFNRNDADRERIRKHLGTQLQAQRRQKEARLDGNMRGAVVNDIHAPFHDPDAVALATKLLRHYDPDVLIYNGDALDFYGLSTYDKNPARVWRLQDEIDACHVDVFAPFGGATRRARKIFLPGNHELRLRKYLWRHPELFGLKVLELPALLELDRFGIEYAELCVLVGDVLEISHGTRVSKWSGMTAKAEQELRRYGISTITGHVHRAGRFQTNTGGIDRIGQEAPCLCSLEPEYMHKPDWVQGVTFFDVRSGALRIDAVQFTADYTAIYNGKVFSAW